MIPKLWRRLRPLLLAAIALLLALILAAAVWATREYTRDPLEALDRDLTGVRAVRDTTWFVMTPDGERREYHDVTLSSPVLGTIRATVSLPDGGGFVGDARVPAGERLPVVMVVGGFVVGRESLKYLPHHGRNALIAYQYPYDPVYWYEGTPLTEIPAIRRAVLLVPAQVTALARWAAGQPWADDSRVSPLGYSFGAFFVPAIYRVAGIHGVSLGSGVIAYGGAGIGPLLRANLKIRPAWWRNFLAGAAALALRPVEPALHIPFVRQDVLFLNGTRDPKIPLESARRLAGLKPEPRTIVTIDAAHMDPRRPELTREVVARSREWLLERGAVGP